MEHLGDEHITKGQSKMNDIMASLHLIFYYGIALAIWGLAFKKFLLLGLIGIGLGFLISLVFVAPVIASQRSAGRTKDMMFAAGAIWGNIAIVIGILGLIAWGIRVLFF